MKSLTAPRLLAIVRAALTIAAFASTGCTAGNSSTTGAVASVTSAESGAQYCVDDASRHTLVLKDAAGHLLRLDHAPGYGWRYLANQNAGDSGRNLSFQPMDLSPVPSAHAQNDATSESNAPTDSQPMAVFIDGPTGYTFAWTGEDGWRFVGRIND